MLVFSLCDNFFTYIKAEKALARMVELQKLADRYDGNSSGCVWIYRE